jgi:hypothetical protein
MFAARRSTTRGALGVLAPMLVVALSAGHAPAGQAPLPPAGERWPAVQPFYDGWYKNADGTVTLSFGYINRKTIPIDVPIGPDNSFSPGDPNRGQPTTFYPGRDLNVVLVTVPASFTGNLTWTVKTDGMTATTTEKGGLNPAYIISELPPRVIPNNAPARPDGGPPQTVQLPSPLKLSATIRANTQSRDVKITYRWTKRAGPGEVTFNPPDAAETLASFSAAGTYLVRLTASRPSGMDSISGTADFRVIAK